MTNESPGFEPQWISQGEHPPADAQAILRDNSEAKRLMVGAGLDLDRFAAEIIRARAEWSSIAALDLSESTQGVRSDG